MRMVDRFAGSIADKQGRIIWFAITLFAVAALATGAWFVFGPSGVSGAAKADAGNPALVARGSEVYSSFCAACHGARLEGQPNWRRRLPNGRLPAPPHDESGHTWHHPDKVLFEIVMDGAAKHAPEGYQSDMPGFRGVLSESDIAAVLAFIKSRWPTAVRNRHERLNTNAGRS